MEWSWNFVYRDLRPIEFDFAARILIQLITLKLFFKFKHEISTLVFAEDNFWSKRYIKNLAAKFFGFENPHTTFQSNPP